MHDSRTEVSPVLCREQAERVASSVTFARAPQLQQLLRWLCDQSLSPTFRGPTEKEIAVSVLNRSDFDPRTDALVRKEMGRLREKILRYYASEGRRDPIEIHAGRGYLLTFARRESERDPERSCWLVLPFRNGSEQSPLGIELLEELLMKLEEAQGPELVSPATALAYGKASADLRSVAAECRADFVVEGSLRHSESNMEANVWLVDGQTGRSRRSVHICAEGSAGELACRIALWLLEKKGRG